jgi:hypothetical protein
MVNIIVDNIPALDIECAGPPGSNFDGIVGKRDEIFSAVLTTSSKFNHRLVVICLRNSDCRERKRW